MGMKRVPARLCHRLAAGRNVGFAVFLGFSGLSGTAITIYAGTGNTISGGVAWSIVGGGVVVSVAAAFIRGQTKLLPNAVVDDVGADTPYTCRYCTAEHLAEACEMTKPYYGNEYVCCDVAEQWRQKNPTGFVEILNRSGELCACFGVLGLTNSFREQFVYGRVSDTLMGPDCVLAPEDSRKAEHLYISGIVVRDPDTYSGQKRAYVMVWAIVHYLKTLYGLRRNRTLIAIAANKESERLMKNLGFRLQCDGKQRVDRCPMYCYEFTKQSVKHLLMRVGDLSPMCELHL